MRWITEDDGLPSDEIYHVIQDEKGLIWFATDDGIVKYDGKNIEVFNKSNGLPGNVVFRLYKINSGKIIGECITNKYFTLSNDKITPFNINDSITKHLGSANISFSYAQDERGNHHFGTRDGMYVLNKKGNLLKSSKLFFPLDSINSMTTGVILFKMNNTWMTSRQFIYRTELNSRSNFLLKFVDNNLTINALIPEKVLNAIDGNSIHIIEIEKDKLCFNYGNGIILTSKNKIVQTKSFESPIWDVFYDQGYVFACSQFHGVYQFKMEGNEIRQVNHFLDGFSVTSGMRSSDGSFWFTTRERGVVQIPDLNLRIDLQVTDDNISAFCKNEKVKIVGTERGFVYLNDKMKKKINLPIYGFLEFGSGSYFALGPSISPVFFNSNEDRSKWNSIRAQINFSAFTHGYIINNKIFGVGRSWYILYDLERNDLIYKLRWGEINQEKIHSSILFDEKVYFAASNGFFKVDINTGQILKKYFSDEVICLQLFRDGILAFSQSGSVYYLKDEQIVKLVLPKFKMINRYYTFFVEGNLLLASNNLGVYKWYIDDKMEFTLIDFTPLPRVNFIGSQGGHWYFATKKMLLTQQKNGRKFIRPSLLMNRVLLNGKYINFSSVNSFDYESNNFQFIFRTIDFKSKFAYYKYKLENHDKEYLYGSSNVINYSALPPGTYTFRISVTTDGFRYSNEIKYTFTIDPPFWRTTWFILIVLVGFLVAITAFFYFRIKRYRERYRIEKMITTLRSQALTTQLNPHLIFNILNSIQGMVSEGEIEQVNTYIAKFSKFMRRTLNMSKQELVSISEEIENTIQYTELEKLRFIDSVKFEFSIDLKDQNVQIPPMIIQPLIENAIKHGIMPKLVNQGKIKVTIRENELSILIQVEDDGIGFRSESLPIGDGLRITKERLEVISPLNELKVIKQVNPTIIQITYMK